MAYSSSTTYTMNIPRPDMTSLGATFSTQAQLEAGPENTGLVSDMMNSVTRACDTVIFNSSWVLTANEESQSIEDWEKWTESYSVLAIFCCSMCQACVVVVRNGPVVPVLFACKKWLFPQNTSFVLWRAFFPPVSIIVVVLRSL